MKPIEFQNWEKACLELGSKDPAMQKLIELYPDSKLTSRGDAFETLLRSIVGQQISVKAAQSIWDRLISSLSAQCNPQSLLEIQPEILRAAGLSQRKVEYSKDLAKHFLSPEFNPAKWQTMDDEEIINQLVDIRGIGRWTAEMFLIFHLLKPNVFPVDDLGLQKALSIHYKVRYPVTKKNLTRFRKQFNPWASVATWYLWRSLDPIPVLY